MSTTATAAAAAAAASVTRRQIGVGYERRRSSGSRVFGDGGLLAGGVSASQAAYEAGEAATGAVGDVLEIADDLDVAAADVQAAASTAAAGQRTARLRPPVPPPGPLGHHPLRLASLRLRELSRDDD